MAIAPLLIGPVSELLNGVLKRLWPEKMSEADKTKIESEVTLALLKADLSHIEKEYEDRASARVLAAADTSKGNALSNVLAATVRPVWGYASLVVVAYPYLAGAMDWPSVTIDDNTKSIVQTVIMFYFGGRTLEKVVETRLGGLVKK